jgi:diguanylate cyclase (GGDEF)-like protein/PAS domain S-box-containing protein
MPKPPPPTTADALVARARRELPQQFERAIAARIKREVLERASWVSLVAGIASVCVAWSLQGYLEPRWLAAWVAVMVLQALVRGFGARLVLTRAGEGDPRIPQLMIASAAFAGAMWGALPWLPHAAPDPAFDFYTAAIVAGVVAGTSVSYASAPQMMLAIAFPALLPAALALALRGDAPGWGGAVLMVLLGALVARESRRNLMALERDIAQYLLLERESRRVMGRETLLRLGADALPEFIAYIDRDHRYAFVNRRYVELLGRSRDSIIGAPMKEVVGDWYAYLKPRLDAALDGEPQDFEVEPPSRVPRDSHYRIRYIPDRREDGGVRGVFAITIEITAYKRAQQELQKRAELDPEYGVLNAASVRERAAREHEMLQRVGGAHALCLADLDGLKAINERHGREVGDAALQRVAAVLAAAMRGSDLVGRLGGDEFVLLFHDCAVEVAEGRCRALLELLDAEPVRVGDIEFPVRASFGVTPLRSVDHDLDAVLARAEAACFAAKHAGGHRVATS